MQVSGIILDEENMQQIKNCGFTNFKIDSNNQMNYHDSDKYQNWCIDQQNKLEQFSKNYMMGQDDAKLFFFSANIKVQNKIYSLFPGCKQVTVNKEDYPLDYDF